MEAEIELLIPVTMEDMREVMLVLGPRRSAEPYARIDIDLLEAIAASLGLLLDRAAPSPQAGSVANETAATSRNVPSAELASTPARRGAPPTARS